MLVETGIPADGDIQSVTPPESRMASGPVAVAECFQEIPCNPCVDACSRGAISKERGINDLPKVDFSKCDGCGACMLQCPGLAIFVVDKSGESAAVRLPYEFYPLPEKGQFACGLGRDGKERGYFEVTRVIKGSQKNKTAAVQLSVPKELAMEVRAIKAGGFKDNGQG